MLNEVIELYLDDIIPNRFQPREKFDEEALKELSASIKEHGVIQPIIVRKIGEKYEIIAGERRYKASALAGLTKIPAIVRNLDDKEASKVALLENLQRQDLTAIEEARTYQKILDLDTMTQEELGKTMGKSQAAIANKLRLLSLSDEVQEALLNNQISERHARSLLNLKNGNEQIEMLNKIIRNRLTVRELDNEIKKMQEGTQTSLPLENNLFNNERIEENNTETNSYINLNDNSNKIESNEIPEIPSKPLEDLNELNINKAIESETNLENKPASFIPDFDRKDDEVEQQNTFIPNFIQTKTPVMINDDQDAITEKIPQYNYDNNFTEPFKLKDAINLVRNVIPELENKGLKARVEEYDLEGKYQIIINIDKNNN